MFWMVPRNFLEFLLRKVFSKKNMENFFPEIFFLKKSNKLYFIKILSERNCFWEIFFPKFLSEFLQTLVFNQKVLQLYRLYSIRKLQITSTKIVYYWVKKVQI